VWTSEDYEALAEELPAAIVRGAADANVLAAIAREKEPGDMTARNYFSVEGTLVAVTVVPVSRESPEERAAGRRTPVDYVAAVDVLDVPRLERLASDVGVTALRFDLTRPAPDKGRLAIEVPGRDGAPVGWISFRNERPGTATFLRRALPIVLGLLLFGATAIAIVQRLVQRQLRAHEKAQRAAEEANVVKSQFLANMSHELRTPLNAIIGYAEMLVEAHEAEGRTQDNDDLQRIQRAGRHLLSLINDILAHSKIEAGKLELEPGDVPIAPLLADVADLVRAAAVANGTALTVDCPTDIGSACADPLRLKQCVLNLASNAVKFTQGGQVSLQAGLTRQGASPAIKIVVRDTGAGIAPQDLARLFQPFVQVDASRTRRFGGTGLGLAITRRLIEAMGGSVTAESEPGVGSTFTLIVPRQTPALRAAA
jgi:signal transduction histidine kinase